MPLEDDGHTGRHAGRRPVRTLWAWLTSSPEDETNPTWNLVRRLAVIVPLAVALLGGALWIVAMITTENDDVTDRDAASNTDITTVRDATMDPDPTTLEPEAKAADSAGEDNLKKCTVTEEGLMEWDLLDLRNPRPSGEVSEEDGSATSVEAVEGYARATESNVWQVILKMMKTSDRNKRVSTTTTTRTMRDWNLALGTTACACGVSANLTTSRFDREYQTTRTSALR